MLPEGEILVDSQVAVEESGPLDVRPDDIAVLPGRWRREAGRVEERSGWTAVPRVANDLRHKTAWCVRAQLPMRAVAPRPLHIERTAVIRLIGRTSLHLRDPRNDPAIHSARRELVAVHRARQ